VITQYVHNKQLSLKKLSSKQTINHKNYNNTHFCLCFGQA